MFGKKTEGMKETMKSLKGLDKYEVIEERHIGDLNSDGYLLKHRKSGAYITLLLNDDENKVFYIGFRTPPKDSTGVAHILEHSVLCGSREFPVKDPFIELAKGSLNTFLNAMTYPDKTVYPVASCNDKDFKNLVHVYLDAVFYPNIYKEEKIFRQEGWHYEMEDTDAPLTINGVVYNEMKGAFSSPDDVVSREVMNGLYPDTTYGLESGGDPEVIPELTYEEFLKFHGKYYHPSNSLIYLYGNLDPEEYLTFLDEKYLSSYETLEVDSAIPLQKPFDKKRCVKREYSVMEDDIAENETYLTYNIAMGSSLDRELYIAMDVLVHVLCSDPGSPVKQALVDAGIGDEVYSYSETGIAQPYFSITANNASSAQQEQFVSIIEEELQKIVKHGIDRKALLATLNEFEFRYREADFGSYPRGLMLGLQALDSWLYDKEKPFIHIEANDTLAVLKEKIETSYYEDLVQKYFIDNRHKAVVVVEPVPGLTGKKEEELADRLAAIKDRMTEEEKQAVVDATKALHAYQQEPSTKEDLAKIPLLKREDMKKEAAAYVNEERGSKEAPVLYHNIFTNGIGYLNLVFDASHVPARLFPYIGILKSIFTLMVDTEHYSYSDLYNEIRIHTGGTKMVFNVYTNAKDMAKVKPTFEARTKFLFNQKDKAVELLEEILIHADFTDTKRLYEILAEYKSDMQATMQSAGHSLAAIRAMSYFSKSAAVTEQVNGIPQYRLLEELTKNFEDHKEELVANLKELCQYLFRPENLLLDYTAPEEGYAGIEEAVDRLRKKLYTGEIVKETYEPVTEKKIEGFLTAGQVQYVCRAGNFIREGLPYTGALRVLKVMMGYDYLWNQVRVVGGAYGCMCSFGRNGDAYFVSYRDPNLEKTIRTYEQAADYIAGCRLDEREVTQFIIGAVSELDTPMTPAVKGIYSLGGYMTGFSMERLQKERDELLAVTPEIIQGLGRQVAAFMKQDYICVVGNGNKLKESKELFMNMEQLFRS